MTNIIYNAPCGVHTNVAFTLSPLNVVYDVEPREPEKEMKTPTYTFQVMF